MTSHKVSYVKSKLRYLFQWQYVYLLPVLVQLLIVASVFDIYFKSPILDVPEPKAPEFPGPARRVVLFVSDGLRAEKFYQPGAAPYLHKVGLSKGVLGLTHTRVPTESRPGHVAMLAGLYEDPSAITRGWTENPVEFDSVFNRTHHSWAWGSPDILPMFAKGAARERVEIFTYDAQFENFAADDSSTLDTWVFDKVEKFFEDALENTDVQLKLRNNQIMFFLHLLGCDTNGHTNKPHSRQYKENIRLVDSRISKIVEIVERYFREDGRTAYVFTSDHGMTDWGSHGTGMDHETVVPLVMWGAGVNHVSPNNVSAQNINYDDLIRNPAVTNIMQADTTPLLATLLGQPIPVHSVGRLPYNLLSMHSTHVAAAAEAQVNQLLAQFQVLEHKNENVFLPSLFYWNYEELTPIKVQGYRASIRKDIEEGHPQNAIRKADELINKVMRGIEYYQRYQRGILKFIITCTIITSFLYHLTHALRNAADEDPVAAPHQKFSNIYFYLPLWGLALLSWFCQRLPVIFLFYYVSPLIFLPDVVENIVIIFRRRQSHDLRFPFHAHTSSALSSRVFSSMLAPWCLGLVVCELVVQAFFYRGYLCFGLISLLLLTYHRCKRGWLGKPGGRTAPLLPQLVLLILLGVFPLLPPVDGRSELLELVLGTSIMVSLGLIYLNRFSNYLSLFHVISNLLAGFIIYYTGNTEGLNPLVQQATWYLFLCSVPISVMTTRSQSDRLMSLSLSLLNMYTLVSLSYESLFLSLLTLLLHWWSSDASTNDNENTKEKVEPERRKLMILTIMEFFFLSFYSFFATGNIASLNSFDPSAIRCFVAVFDPFLMGGLLLIKILIPFLVTAIHFQHIFKVNKFELQTVTQVMQSFSCFLSLHFFHFVQDTGSWQEIGTSLSHFIIVEGTTLFLMLFLRLASLLCNCLTSTESRKKLS